MSSLNADKATFCRTLNGATVGNLFMSLIHTAAALQPDATA